MRKLTALILIFTLLGGNANVIFAQDKKLEKIKRKQSEDIVKKSEELKKAALKAEQVKQGLAHDKEVYREFYNTYKNNGFSEAESKKKAVRDFEEYKGHYLAYFINRYLSFVNSKSQEEFEKPLDWGHGNDFKYLLTIAADFAGLYAVGTVANKVLDGFCLEHSYTTSEFMILRNKTYSSIGVGFVALFALQTYAYVSTGAVKVSSFNFQKTTEEKMKLLEEKPQYFILPDKEDANYLWHVTGLQEVFQEYPYMEKYMEDVTYVNGLMAKYSFILPVLEQKEWEKNSEYFARYAEELRKLDESVWPEYSKYLEQELKKSKFEYAPPQRRDAAKTDGTAVRQNKVLEYLPDAYKR